MATPLISLFAGLALMLSTPAWAQDDSELDDDFGGDDDDDDEPKTKSTEEEVPLDVDPENDDNWTVQPESGQDKLDFDEEFEDDTQVQVTGAGQDTARVYREYLEEVEDLGPDEEALAWERYLKKYPATAFRSRIEARMEELSFQMYDENIEDRYSGTEDAGRAELQFAQPVTIDSIDPRTKIRGGVDLGFPEYAGLHADLEWQLWREMSVHGGIRGRPQGQNIEVGGRYAIVKSARTNLLVTVNADFHLNVNPLQPGIRPVVGVGKRFGDIGGFYTDLILQGGGDFVFVNTSAGKTAVSLREVGGLHATFSPSATVRVWMEGSLYMKGIGDDSVPSAFQFNVFSFGLKFIGRKNPTTERYQVGVGANAPMATKYWAYHFGAVSADFNYFLD